MLTQHALKGPGPLVIWAATPRIPAQSCACVPTEGTAQNRGGGREGCASAKRVRFVCFQATFARGFCFGAIWKPRPNLRFRKKTGWKFSPMGHVQNSIINIMILSKYEERTHVDFCYLVSQTEPECICPACVVHAVCVSQVLCHHDSTRAL